MSEGRVPYEADDAAGGTPCMDSELAERDKRIADLESQLKESRLMRTYAEDKAAELRHDLDCETKWRKDLQERLHKAQEFRGVFVDKKYHEAKLQEAASRIAELEARLLKSNDLRNTLKDMLRRRAHEIEDLRCVARELEVKLKARDAQHCGTCTWWCLLACKNPDSPAFYDVNCFMCKADFGCVLWSAKDKGE